MMSKTDPNKVKFTFYFLSGKNIHFFRPDTDIEFDFSKTIKIEGETSEGQKMITYINGRNVDYVFLEVLSGAYFKR